MNKERLFVIMEVKETDLKDSKGAKGYVPVGSHVDKECLWLQPERIIKASRLRYGVPVAGERVFLPEIEWGTQAGFASHAKLILDPEPEEKDEWDGEIEQWAKDCPVYQTAEGMIGLRATQWQDFISWLKQMPRRNRNGRI